MHMPRLLRLRPALVALGLLLTGAILPAQVPPGQDLLVDPFTAPTSEARVNVLNVNTPGFPCLTAVGGGPSSIPNCGLATPDPDGEGLLRLTEAEEGRASAIISARDLPTLKGLKIRFTQYQWGGVSIGGSPGGGDGIAFFLAVSPPIPGRLGPQGGALGYTSDGGSQGLENGWLGIGLDAFGNFGNPDFGSPTCPAPENWGPTGDQITVRGPEHSGYCLISSSADHGGLPGGISLRGDTRAASKRRIEIIIDPDAGTYTVGIDPTGGNDFQPATSGPLPTAFADPSRGGAITEDLPARLTFGFSASTGSATDVHEIGDVEVRTLSGAVPTLALTQTTTLVGSPSPGDAFEYVLAARVGATAPVEFPIRISDTLPQGVTLEHNHISGNGWECNYSELIAFTCSYDGGVVYPIPAGTQLPELRVPVVIDGMVPIGTMLVNNPYVISDDAAAAYHASSTVVVANGINVTTGALPDGTVGASYGALLTSTAMTAATWTIENGALPAGLTLSPDGTLAGTPTTAGTASFAVRVTDSMGAVATASLAITIAAGTQPVTIPTGSLPAGPSGTFALPGGTVGVVYTAALTASGGSGAITWSLVSGALPAGLTLAPTGAVTGTPTTAGTAIFTAGATDTAGSSATVPLSIVVEAAPVSIPTGSLPAGPSGTFALPGGTVGVVYTAALTASGGSGAITWSLVSGALPAGLTLAPTGAVTGTPTTAGTGIFTARATDTAGSSATVPLSIVVAAAPVSIPTGSLPAGPSGTFALPGGTVGVVYTAALTASGGSGAITWSLVSGALPAGLTLAPTGTVTGTPTTAGTAIFTARATDTVGSSATVPLSIVIAAAPVSIPTGTLPAGPSGTFALPGGTVGVVYTAALTASGGSGAITWSLVSGALPAGLTLAPTGAVTGTPTIASTAIFTARATDTAGSSATVPLSIVVAAAPVSIPTGTLPAGPSGTFALPGGTVGVVYTAALTASGGSGAITWSLVSGALPAGLTLAPNGTVTGTPTIAGTAIFTARATDTAGSSATVPLSIVVAPGATAPPITITTGSLPAGRVGQSYAASLNATGGGTGTFTWSIASGSLPAGLALAASGIVSGTPTTAGTASFTVRASKNGNSATRALSIAVSAAPLRVSPQRLPFGRVGAPYSATLAAIGGVPPYRWSIASGSLNPGLSLSPAGVITGTPSRADTDGQWFRLRVTDATGRTDEAMLEIAVSGLRIINVSLRPIEAGDDAWTSINATDGIPDVDFQIVGGALPPGTRLVNYPHGCYCAYIRGGATAAGTFTFTVRATDRSGATDQRTFSIEVTLRPLRLPRSEFRYGLVGVASWVWGEGLYPLYVDGHRGATYTWQVISGALPPGVTLTPAGTFVGAATTAGTYTVQVQVTDSFGRVGQTTVTIWIIPNGPIG
jgi:large repetitive protein